MHLHERNLGAGARLRTQANAESPELQILTAGALPDQAVYLDSPVISALRQIIPFYDSGVFDGTETPLYLRVKPVIKVQLAVTRKPRGVDIRQIRGGQISRMPLSPGAVVFYPFNSQSNMNAVTNRKAYHVLTLHGESNKLASSRAAARLYDYIAVAGDLARDRYLEAGIFTAADVDNGRLVMMGDSFVQDLRWIVSAAVDDAEAALLYCPTWEGYGKGPNNYCSMVHGRGFSIAAAAAAASDTRRIVVKPHPYLGLLQPGILRDFVAGIRQLADGGFRIELALGDANLLVRTVARTRLNDIPRFLESKEVPLRLKLGLCDVSGMEAVFLKQRIAHLVITREADIPVQLDYFYRKKAILPASDVERTTKAYIDDAPQIDAIHRGRVFSWHEPALAVKCGAARRNWLIDHVRRDPFWKSAGRGGGKCV